MAEPHIKVDGREYDLPTDIPSYDTEDCVIVTLTTGVDFLDWTAKAAHNNMQTLIGMVAVAIRRGNPDWDRDRVVAYVAQMKVFQVLETLTEVEGDVEDPTSPNDDSGPSSGSSNGSTSSADTDSAPTNLAHSGNQHSPMSSDSNHGSWER